MTSDRARRLRTLASLLRGGGIASQEEATARLRSLGFAVTQATVSRDLDRLVGAPAQAVLPAAGSEREARRRAHRGVRVAVGEAHAGRGDRIEAGRAARAAAVAAEVGVAEIVSEDEDEAGSIRP